jgi:tetratricopeptide (TPR) repeat protein
MTRRGTGEQASKRGHAVALLQAGLARHQAGQLAEAETAYRAALAADPALADALHLLGIVALQRGRSAEALGLIDRAVALQPGNAAFFTNRGLVLGNLGRTAEALDSYDRALALQPGVPEAHSNRGNALRDLGRMEEALGSYGEAARLRPAYPEAWANQASVLVDLGRPAEALAACDRALALRPAFPEVLANRAAILSRLGRPEEALAACDRALALAPENGEAWGNRAAALLDLGRPAEALAACDRALALRPDDAKLLADRSAMLWRLDRPEDALATADAALARAPDNVDAWCHRGLALVGLNRIAEARDSYARGLALRPADPDIRFSQAWADLLAGNLAAAWPDYEARWRLKRFASPPRDFAQPRWRGEALDGRTILLHAEQGLGDTIQFCRYAPLVARHGGRVVLEVQAPLEPLLAGLPGVTQIVRRGDPLPPFDLHCPLLSLPLAFGTTLATIPPPVADLRADAGRMARWAPRFAGLAGRRAGLVWAGNTSARADIGRPLRLATVRPLLDCGASVVALQHDVPEADRADLADTPGLANLGGDFADFADTAAVIAQLDLVIAVDTSVAHLSGALGKPTWIMLRTAPDWRWLLDRDDSPWYPSVRLFRQSARGDWDGVVAKVAAALAEFG